MKESAGIVGHMMRVIVALTRVTLAPMTVADCIPDTSHRTGCRPVIMNDYIKYDRKEQKGTKRTAAPS